jgi:hypothetical protein
LAGVEDDFNSSQLFISSVCGLKLNGWSRLKLQPFQKTPKVLFLRRLNFRPSRLGRSTPLCQRKTEGGLEKGLANLWRGKRIKK